jgi:transglutaminase-like putative cysteine protease
MINSEFAGLSCYLASDDVVDWKDSAVSDKARALTDGLENEIEKARLLFEWVRDEISHTNDIGAQVVTCSASEVLQVGTGICYAKSHLLAGFLRSIGIPTGFCYQVLRRSPPHTGSVLHGLNGVYLDSAGKWARIDPRGNTGGIDAQFDLKQERLAFPTDDAAGEFVYDTVFAAPAPVVVDTLRRFSSRSAMWPYLPQDLASGRTQQDAAPEARADNRHPHK